MNAYLPMRDGLRREPLRPDCGLYGYEIYTRFRFPITPAGVLLRRCHACGYTATMPLYDFHAHTFFSDGALLPMELIRRAQHNGYTALAITDHASASNIEELVEKVARDCQLAWDEWRFPVLPGVELTHCPPRALARLAAQAKRAGAKIVVVHGETLVEPVPPGTNRASVECPDIDVLGHPGLLTEEEAVLARVNGVYLELTSRRGHCLGNGNTINVGRAAGASFLINSDTHSPGDLHTEGFARTVALGAGLTHAEADTALYENPLDLLRRAGAALG